MTRWFAGLVCVSALVSAFGCNNGGQPSDDDDDPSSVSVGGSATGAGGTGAGAGGSASAGGSGGSVPFGAPEVLADNLNLPTGVAVDDTHVYWSETGTWEPNYLYNGKIIRMPKEGGTPTTLSTGRQHPLDVRADGSFAYWIDQGSSSFFDPQHPGRVLKVPASGGTTTELVESGAGEPFFKMAMGDTHLYFTMFWEVRRVAKTGGPDAPVVGAQDDIYGLTLDATSVYWTTKPVNESIGSIQKVGLAGGATLPISDATEPGAVAVTSDTIFWVEEGNRLMSQPLAGGTPVPVANGSGILALLADGNFLYWADCGGGAVVAIPLNGGDPITVASGLGCAYALAVDATHVYWADRGETFTYPPPKQHAGQVMRATKGH